MSYNLFFNNSLIQREGTSDEEVLTSSSGSILENNRCGIINVIPILFYNVVLDSFKI